MSAQAKETDGLPRHIAVIMDGNGRWARERGLSRARGHAEGAESVRVITRECARLGIKRLTLYAFSTENWRRPMREVDFLMRLLKRFLVRERREIMDNNIRFAAIGRLEELPAAVRKELERTAEMSRKNSGMTLCLALNYGGRQEIADAARRIARDAASGKIKPDEIDEVRFASYLYDPDMPDPDLVIRTSGEMRLSNFLLWQNSYAEIYSTMTFWPDFRLEELKKALKDYARRERRFGAISEDVKR
jgi:undecaprenyl diphosphate synthase